MEKEFLTKRVLFPFHKIQYGSSVVIYGMGKLGNEYIKQIQATKYAKIKYTVDKNYKNISYEDIQISSPEILKNENESIIIIAISSSCERNQIKHTLMEWGIPKSRIISESTYYAVSVKEEHNVLRQYTSKEEFLRFGKENEQMLYLQHMYNICRILRIKRVDNRTLVRIGNDNDGGYVMLDDIQSGGIAYSFGIAADVTWDEEMANLNYDVFMYDHTIVSLPYQNDRFHFASKGIASSLEHSDKLDTLENLIKVNSHSNVEHMILKMDVEGAEWGFLDMVQEATLMKFDQIILELHDVFNVKKNEQIVRCLKKLTKTHQFVHVHANNAGHCRWVDADAFPDIIEVLCANRNSYKFHDEDVNLPIVQDSPNVKVYPEIVLGNWNHR